jgi:CheY-like chemotaxis protein
VLLIDDEQSVRSIVLKILRRAKYNVLEAETG